MPDPIPVATVKPGYKTTEFWFRIAAALLTAVFASGLVTNNTALQIAGIAATWLTAEGYNVNRTLVKNAASTGVGALLVVLGLASASSSGCANIKPALAAGAVAVLECEDGHLDAVMLADAKAFAAAEVRHWIAGGAGPTTAAIKADLVPIKSDLGRCAIAGALAAAAGFGAPPPSGPPGLIAPPEAGSPPVLVAFSVAARSLGWPPVRVGGAVL